MTVLNLILALLCAWILGGVSWIALADSGRLPLAPRSPTPWWLIITLAALAAVNAWLVVK